MGDWFRDKVEAELVVERDGWAAERVERVTARLQAGVPEAERLETLVIWIDPHTAFTGPGRTIYVARRLLENLPDDDAVAMVIAHELAHHRLGHVPRVWPAWYLLPLRLVRSLLHRRIASTERERDADLLATEACLAAGYDLERCVDAFGRMEHIVLDYGDVDGVLGSEDGSADRVHDAIRARIAAIRRHGEAYRRGVRISLDVTRDRERRRRKVALATAAGAVGTVALILLRRRF